MIWLGELAVAVRPVGDAAKATGQGRKGMITIASYVLAIGIAFFWPLVAVLIYLIVAAVWIIPDKRFERLID